MLSSLRIENIAVIEQAEIEFHPGFNVLTGETGAGKSIIIDAINAVLGERTSRDLIRSGAENARVSAFFEQVSAPVLQHLETLGVDAEEDASLLILRTISADGKSACRINGKPVTASMLREIAKELINIHGQHDNQSLLQPETHLSFLDAVAENSAEIEEYRAAYRTLCALEKERSSFRMDEAEKARRLDLLRFQVNELEQAALRPGEKDELLEQRSKIQHAERITQCLHSAYECLEGGEEGAGAHQLLVSASQSLVEASRFDPQLSQLAQTMQELSYSLEEYGEDIRGQFSDLEYDPQRLDEIEARLDELYRLSRKYGASEQDMLDFLEQAQEELSHIQFAEEHLAKLEDAYRTAYKKAGQCAALLTKIREETGLRFASQIRRELSFLDMPQVQFSVSRKEAPFSISGADEIEFLLSANPGEPLRPIAKIASGGELSRIMLAIKNVLSDKDAVETLIFDEVDTGVSGRAAQKIGQKLRQVARGRQVICVTHLAQIAALADSQLLIEKQIKGGKTFTHVHTLDWEGRKRELARIIGGEELTDLQLQSAEEMLLRANNA